MLSAQAASGTKRRKPPPRLIVSYVDGSWSDRIAARRVEVETQGAEITLTLELAPRAKVRDSPAANEAMRGLADKQFIIESLQVTRPRVVAHLRHELRHTENVVIRVRLVGPGIQVDYPGSVVFGPDAVTLSFG